MYDEILVPTDGSPAADTAIEHAIAVASQFGSRIHALYIVDGTAYSAMEGGSEAVVEALESEGEEAVEHVAAAAEDAGVPVTTTVETGTPYRAITEYVGANGIDLVVMGTHGRRGIDRYLLGSVTERVVRTADVPVLTVRELEDDGVDDG